MLVNVKEDLVGITIKDCQSLTLPNSMGIQYVSGESQARTIMILWNRENLTIAQPHAAPPTIPSSVTAPKLPLIALYLI
jgi:hypothetical protein